MTIAIGQEAPGFELPNQHGEPVSLSSFRGRSAVALVFFPLAFSRTCAGELGELRDNSRLFTDAGAEVLAISVDSKHALRAWGDAENYELQLLSDFWPHGEVARRYGVFREATGVASRTTVLVDRDGVVSSAFSSSPAEARPLSAYRSALALLDESGGGSGTRS
ncbi:peroxiredoxin [Naasia sp. SYSU D00948]|uniref:peroxiredoxin n=1 Tax=Naasia sp. SYSU D00948 TaxID=2817379 RepID=UPI0027DD46E8|nr:peroxiredoxin [Naasia sp. SYSU D00948]